ncbi:MAG: hypothetical protein JW759_04610 [Candidatus Coatesbacteria bacterium]|nr:hypothetical protein [Candidatus Coatesbacteria bacterium]
MGNFRPAFHDLVVKLSDCIFKPAHAQSDRAVRIREDRAGCIRQSNDAFERS